jgi:dTDP-L-rhamnose 4-epimerase
VYGASKRGQEELCLVTGAAYHIPTTCFRYFGVYGRRQLMTNPYTGIVAMFAARLVNGRRPLVFEDGRQLRDLIHVSDVCRAVLAVIREPIEPGPVNLGSGQPVQVREVAQMLALILAPDIEPETTFTYRKGDIRTCFPDVGRAERLLGFEPRVALEDGLADFAEWAKEHIGPDNVDHMRAELDRRSLLV